MSEYLWGSGILHFTLLTDNKPLPTGSLTTNDTFTLSQGVIHCSLYAAATGQRVDSIASMAFKASNLFQLCPLSLAPGLVMEELVMGTVSGLQYRTMKLIEH